MDPTPEKAKKMLRDGTAHGKSLTPRQKRYLGFVAGGGKSHKESTHSSHYPMDDYMLDYMMPPMCVHTAQGGTVRTEFARMKGKGDARPTLDEFDSEGNHIREPLTEEYRG